ncbi:MAG: prephenate dehydrogenase [Ruminococcaceae bacterium]|nr:prephenate dehydrogenase [Oscillospiraceae bacterium]
MNIAVVGLGLIGGSLAKSIKARTSHTVYGCDINEETMLLARLCGAIDGELGEEQLPQCDIILVALRPAAAVEWVKSHAESISKNAAVIDMCGVKRTVCAELSAIADQYGFAYIGGHPMAGKERGKFINSADTLFAGAPMILTPDERTTPQLLETLEKLFTDIGFGRMVYTTPDEHDRIIAYTSQLAHITSSAYIKSPEAQRQRGFSAGSYRDMTRVAHLDEDMWTELCMDNADYLTEQAELLAAHLQEYITALRGRDEAALRALFRDGREKKASAGGN